MSLTKFLEAMKVCPDAELEPRLGIYYDWPILLKASYTRTVSVIRGDTERWVKSPQATREYASALRDSGKTRMFNYVPGTMTMQVMSWMAVGPMEDEEQQELEVAGYRTSIWLGHYDGRQPDMPRTSPQRAAALAIADLIQLVQKNGIPTCFPRARFGSEMLRYES